MLRDTWPIVKLEDVCEVRRGSVITKKKATAGEIPVIAGGKQPAYYHNSHNRRPPVVTISASGAYAGFVNFFTEPIYASDCSTIQPISKDRISLMFLYLWLRYNQNKIYTLQQGGAQPHVYPRDLKKISVPIPPLAEQRKIATVLNKIQKNIKAKEELVRTTKELKKSTMKYLFTYGVNKEKTKQTEIGEIPASWEVKEIDSLFHLKQGKSLSSKDQTGRYLKPFLRTSNVFWGYLNLEKIDHMDIPLDIRDTLRLKENDLLVCEGGDIGRTAIWKNNLTECYFQNHIHRLRARSVKISFPLFYMYWMDLGVRMIKAYGSFGNRTTIPNLPGKRLLQFQIPLPPLSEQKKIASTLSKIDERIRNYEEQKQALQDLFKAMLHKLMTGQIRAHNLDIDTSEVEI